MGVRARALLFGTTEPPAVSPVHLSRSRPGSRLPWSLPLYRWFHSQPHPAWGSGTSAGRSAGPARRPVWGASLGSPPAIAAGEG